MPPPVWWDATFILNFLNFLDAPLLRKRKQISSQKNLKAQEGKTDCVKTADEGGQSSRPPS